MVRRCGVWEAVGIVVGGLFEGGGFSVVDTDDVALVVEGVEVVGGGKVDGWWERKSWFPREGGYEVVGDVGIVGGDWGKWVGRFCGQEFLRGCDIAGGEGDAGEGGVFVFEDAGVVATYCGGVGSGFVDDFGEFSAGCGIEVVEAGT